MHACACACSAVHVRLPSPPFTSGCLPPLTSTASSTAALCATPQAALAEDYDSLAKAFQDTGFVNRPVIYLGEDPTIKSGYDPVTGEDLGLAQFAKVDTRRWLFELLLNLRLCVLLSFGLLLLFLAVDPCRCSPPCSCRSSV